MQDLENETTDCCKCVPISADDPCNAPKIFNKISESGEKFYQQISTEMIGNLLTIRVEKDQRKKMKKLRNGWDPRCDCNMVEIRRPNNIGENPKIVNGGENNQILFKVYSKTDQIGKDSLNYKPQAIAYKIGSCESDSEYGNGKFNNKCRKITVYPQLGGAAGSQEVHSDRITEGNEDIFLLRVKKKPDTIDQRQRNIELELRTPKPPTPSLKLNEEMKIKNSLPVIQNQDKKLKDIFNKNKGKKGKEKVKGKKKK